MDGGSEDARCFSASDFRDDTFDANSFIAKCQTRTSLPQLRDQLRSHLGTLQEELYQLINRDYEDFVRLSSRLDGLGALSQRLRPPLHEMRQKVAAAEEALGDELDDANRVLTQRAAARRVHTYLLLVQRAKDVEAEVRSVLSGPELGVAAAAAAGETHGDVCGDMAFARRLAGDDAAWTDEVLGLAPPGEGEDAAGLTVPHSPRGDGGREEEEEEEEVGDGSDLSTAAGLTREALVLERAARLLSDWRQLAAAAEAEEEAAVEAATQLPLGPRPAVTAERAYDKEEEKEEEEEEGDGDGAAEAMDKPDAAELTILPGAEQKEQEKVEQQRHEQEKALPGDTPSSEGGACGAVDLGAVVARSAAERAEGSSHAPALAAFSRRAQRALRAALVAAESPSEALACLVRGMAAAGLESDVEAVTRTAVVEPVLAARLTRGRIDAGQRGSYRGLAAVLRDSVDAADRALAPLAAAARRSGGRVDLWAHALWPALADALGDPALGGLISPGDAATMHANYVAVLAAVDEVEGRRAAGLGSAHDCMPFLAATGPVRALLSQFNLDLYAQLLRRRLASDVDGALSAPVAQAPAGAPGGVSLAPAAAVWRAALHCFSASAFLPEKADALASLACLAVARFQQHCADGVRRAAEYGTSATREGAIRVPNPGFAGGHFADAWAQLPRALAPKASGNGSGGLTLGAALWRTAQDAEALAASLGDAVAREARGGATALPKAALCPSAAGHALRPDAVGRACGRAVRAAAAPCRRLADACRAASAASLHAECATALGAMQRLTTAARVVSADDTAGSGGASPYVADAVAPMRAFARREGGAADPGAWPAPLRSWCGQAGGALHASFAAAATELVDAAKKQEVALRRLKRRQGKRLSESERLCRQLRADMEALNAELADLGVHVAEWPLQKRLEATLGQ